MECITTTSFFVLANGTLEGKFKPTRGIRRGILITIHFYCMLEHLGLISSFYVECPRSDVWITNAKEIPEIPYLMFADGYLIFFKGYLISFKAFRNPKFNSL